GVVIHVRNDELSLPRVDLLIVEARRAARNRNIGDERQQRAPRTSAVACGRDCEGERPALHGVLLIAVALKMLQLLYTMCGGNASSPVVAVDPPDPAEAALPALSVLPSPSRYWSLSTAALSDAHAPSSDEARRKRRVGDIAGSFALVPA